MAEEEDGWSVTGAGNELAHVYEADAEAAGVAPVRKCASEWVRGIKGSITTAARNAEVHDGERHDARHGECDGDCDHEGDHVCDADCDHEAAGDDGEDDGFVATPCCGG